MWLFYRNLQVWLEVVITEAETALWPDFEAVENFWRHIECMRKWGVVSFQLSLDLSD